jgi:hypothetical protein
LADQAETLDFRAATTLILVVGRYAAADRCVVVGRYAAADRCAVVGRCAVADHYVVVGRCAVADHCVEVGRCAAADRCAVVDRYVEDRSAVQTVESPILMEVCVFLSALKVAQSLAIRSSVQTWVQVSTVEVDQNVVLRVVVRAAPRVVQLEVRHAAVGVSAQTAQMVLTVAARD